LNRNNGIALLIRCIAAAFFLLAANDAGAQAISAYTDYRGYFMAFDKGAINKLEYLPVTSYKMGSSCIAYIDNRNDFKIYYNGQSKFQLNAADFKYWVTDYLVAYKVGQVLYVNDAGTKKTLCYYNTKMVVNDSLLSWFDDSQYTFKIYYNGRTAELESSLLEPPKVMKAGPNTLAWVNQSNFFSLFYQGNVTVLDNIAPLDFAAGRDIMCWTDDYDRYFHVFYRGDTATLETFAPDSFKVGYGIMAYVDQLGNFNAFFNGGTSRLLPDRPTFFQVNGNVIVYAYNNQLNVFYEGRNYPVERYIPTNLQVGLNGVAYLDPGGALKYFFKGKSYPVTTEFVTQYALTGDVLKVEVGTNTNQFFWEGQLYE
jgi:hypothetical protein